MKTKSIEESIIVAMETDDTGIVKYLPYILQDFWEIGTSPELIIEIVKKHKHDYSNLSVLDLGSGKGAVSIKLAAELKCKCHGIDAIEDFIVFSNNKSKEYSVSNICSFERNDIRTRIKTLGKYDIIILGAIGPILGDYYDTLSQLASHINNNGIIIINDAYVEDGYNTDYPNIFQKSNLIKQIKKTGMEIIDSITDEKIPNQKDEHDKEFENLEKRCLELVEKYPKEKNIFLKFAETQKKLYEKLDNEITSVVFVVKNLK